MKFKLDENLPAEAVLAFHSNGHDAETVVDEGLGGVRDPLVLAACQKEGRAIVTLDTDFANIIAYPPATLLGLIVLRPARQSKTSVLRVLDQLVIPRLAKEVLVGKLWVVDDSRVRVHG